MKRREGLQAVVVPAAVLGAGLLVVSYCFSCKNVIKVAKARGHFVDVHIKVPVPWLFAGVKDKPSKVIYLNREGAVLRGGSDDAPRNRASLAGASASDRVQIPGYRGSYSNWKTVVKCVKEAFAPFDVEVVDQRPVGREYVMALFGGHPTNLKRKDRAHLKAAGLAPFNGLPIPKAVVLVFTRKLGDSTRQICETATHEVGHAYGLDHVMECRDYMTYLKYCGKKRFVDKAAPCGEHKGRKCKGGKADQNSHQDLVRVLGAKK